MSEQDNNGGSQTPQNNGGSSEDNKTEEIIQRRVGAYSRKAKDAEDRAARAEQEAAAARAEAEALKAENEMMEQEKRDLELQAQEGQIMARYPVAADYLSKHPQLGIVAENPQEYEQKLSELNAQLSGTAQQQPQQQKVNTPQYNQQSAPSGEPLQPTSTFVSPNAPQENQTHNDMQEGTMAQKIKNAANMSVDEWRQLPDNERNQILQSLDEFEQGTQPPRVQR